VVSGVGCGTEGKEAGLIYRLKESVLRRRLQLRSTRVPDCTCALLFFPSFPKAKSKKIWEFCRVVLPSPVHTRFRKTSKKPITVHLK
jgi:hypothetical protein